MRKILCDGVKATHEKEHDKARCEMTKKKRPKKKPPLVAVLLAALRRVEVFEFWKDMLGEENRAASYLAMRQQVREAIAAAERIGKP